MTKAKIFCLLFSFFFLGLPPVWAVEEQPTTDVENKKEERKPDATETTADTATATTTATPETKPSGDTEEVYGKMTGLAGPVVFGPKVTLVGLPTPFRAGIEAKYLNLFGFSADYGFIPKLSFSKVSVKMNSLAFTGKWYPWRRSFYLGVGVAKQNITATATDTVNGTEETATLNLGSTLVTPQIGWRWTGTSGFFMGMELGAQIPIGTSSEVTTTASAANQADPKYVQIKKDVEDKSKDLGDTPLPYFALLQMGFFF